MPNQQQFESAKLQTTLSEADNRILLELAEAMTLSVSSLASLAIRQWLLENRAKYLSHYDPPQH